MSLLGFVFGFGARDDGADKAFRSAGNQIEQLNSLLAQSGEAASHASGMGIERFSSALDALSLTGLASTLDELVGKGSQLTGNLEQQAIGMRDSALQAAVQMGLTGAEANKAVGKMIGTAISANVGVEETAQAFKVLQTQGKKGKEVIDALGLSFKDLATQERFTGMSTEEFGGVIGDLNKSFSFGADNTAKLMNKLAVLNKGTKLGTNTFSGMKTTLDGLNEVLAKSGAFVGMSAQEQQKKVEDFILQTNMLAGAFRENLGATPEEAMEKANAATKAILETGGSIEQMSAGLGDGFSEQFTQLAQAAGLKATDALLDNPMKLMEVFAELGKGKTAEELTRLKSAAESIAPGFAFLIDVGDDAVKTMKGFEKSLKDAGDASGSFNKSVKAAFTDNRTIDDYIQLTEDRFDQFFRNISKAERKGFLKAHTRGYKELSKFIKKNITHETYGPLLKRLSMIHGMGVAGVFMPMSKDAKGAERSLSKLNAALSKGGLSGRIAAVLEYGIVGFFMDLNQETKVTSETVKDATKKFEMLFAGLKIAGPALGIAAAGVGALGFAMSKLVGPLMFVGKLLGRGGLLGALKAVGVAVVGFLGWPVTIAIALTALGVTLFKFKDKVMNFITDMADRASDMLAKAWEGLAMIDGAKLADNLIDSLKGAVDKIIGFFKGDIPSSKRSDAMGSALSTMLDNAIAVGLEVGRIAKEFGGKLLDIFVESVSGIDPIAIAASLKDTLVGAFNSLDTGGAGTTVGGALRDAFFAGLEYLNRIDFAQMLSDGFDLVDSLQEWLIGSLDTMVDSFDPIAMVNGMMDKVDEFVEGLVGGDKSAFNKGIQDAEKSGALGNFVKAIGSFIVGSVRLVAKSSFLIGKIGRSLIEMLIKVAGALWTMQGRAVLFLGKAFIGMVTGAVDMLHDNGPMIEERIKEFIITPLVNGFTSMRDKFNTFIFDNVVQPLDRGISNLKFSFQKMIDGIVGFFSLIPSKVSDFFVGPDGITSKISSLGDRIKASGVEVVEQLWQGMKDKWTEVAAWFENTAIGQGIRKLLPSSAPKAGPLEGATLPNSGKKILNLIGEGFTEGEQAFKDLFSGVIGNAALSGSAAMASTFQDGLAANFMDQDSPLLAGMNTSFAFAGASAGRRAGDSFAESMIGAAKVKAIKMTRDATAAILTAAEGMESSAAEGYKIEVQGKQVVVIGEAGFNKVTSAIKTSNTHLQSIAADMAVLKRQATSQGEAINVRVMKR